MSKRGAEKQLTDRDRDDDDGEDEGSESGTFAAAPPQVIATRKIRGLPQRKSQTPSFIPPPSAPPAESKSPFGNFPGFAPLATPSPPSTPAVTNPFAFPTTASTTPTSFSPAQPLPTFSFSSPSPLVSPTSEATPAPPNTFPGTPSFSFPPKPPSDQDPALKYFMSLRSLNLALMESLQNQIDRDPFVNFNINNLLKNRYEQERKKIEDEFEQSGGKKGAKTSNGTGSTGSEDVKMSSSTSVAASSVPTITTTPPTISVTPAPAPPAPTKPKSPPPVPSFALPAPPKAFSFGGSVIKPSAESVPSSSPSSSTSGGFVPTIATGPPDPYAEKSLFTFPPPSIKPILPPNAPVAPSPLRFGESVSPPLASPVEKAKPKEDAKPATTSKAGKFSFGATFGDIAKGDPPPASTVDTPKPTLSTPAPSPSNPFAFPAYTPKETVPPVTTSAPAPVAKPIALSAGAPAFSFNPSTPPTAPSTKISSSPPIAPSVWGAKNSPPLFGFGAALAKPPAPVVGSTPGFSFGGGGTGFAFGGAASTTTPASGGFGTGSSLGGFGSQSGTGTGFGFGLGSRSVPAKTSVGFSFGGASSTAPSLILSPVPLPSPAPTPETSTDVVNGEEGGAGEDASIQAKPAASDADQDAGTELVYEVRGRVTQITGSKEEELGICLFKVLREVEGKKRCRLIGRDLTVSATPKLNFWIPVGIKVTILQKSYLNFVGITDTGPQKYRIRVKTEHMAAEFKKILEDSAPQAT